MELNLVTTAATRRAQVMLGCAVTMQQIFSGHLLSRRAWRRPRRRERLARKLGSLVVLLLEGRVDPQAAPQLVQP